MALLNIHNDGAGSWDGIIFWNMKRVLTGFLGTLFNKAWRLMWKLQLRRGPQNMESAGTPVSSPCFKVDNCENMICCGYLPIVERHSTGGLCPVGAGHHQKGLCIGEHWSSQLVAHHLPTIALLCVLSTDVRGVLAPGYEEVVLVALGFSIIRVRCVPTVEPTQLERLCIPLFESNSAVTRCRPYTGWVVQAVQVARPNGSPAGCLVAKVARLVVHYRAVEIERRNRARDACVVLQASSRGKAVWKRRVLTIAWDLSDQDFPSPLSGDFVKPLNNCARAVCLVVHANRLWKDWHCE